MKQLISKIYHHSLFRGSAVMFLGATIVNIGNYFYHLLMGRMLGPADYGVLESVISSLYILGIVSIALGIAVTKYVSEFKGKNDNNGLAAFYLWIQSRLLICGLLVSLVLILITPVWSAFLKLEDNNLIYGAVAIFFLSIFLVTGRSYFGGLLKFGYYNASTIAEVAVKIGAGVLLIMLGFSTGGAIAGIILSALAGYLIMIPFIRFMNNGKKIIFERQKEFVIFMIIAFGSAIGFTSLYSTDIILVKHYFSAHDAGIYASISVLGKIVFFMSSSLVSVMFPMISQKSAKGEKYRSILWLTFFAVLLLSLAVTVVYLLFPSQMINILFGSKYLSGQNLLFLFGVFISLYSLSNVLVNYFLSVNYKRAVLFPLAAAMLQIILIINYHFNLSSVIFCSIISAVILLIGLLIYYIYDQRRKETAVGDSAVV